MDHLEAARTNLRRASEQASRQVHTQLDSLQFGISREEGRDPDREGSDSQIDRIAEVRDKLESLQDEAEDPEVEAFLQDASDHLREHMEEHAEDE